MTLAPWLLEQLQLQNNPGVMEESYVRERLNRHLPAEPHAYVLALVASAVMADASYLKITNDSNDFVLLRDGRTPTPEELEGLFGHMLHSGASPERAYLVDLAVGLNAAMALNPKSVIVETWGSWGGSRYQLLGTGHKLEALKTGFTDPRATFRVQVREPRRLGKLMKMVTGFPPEGDLIARMCAQATPKITVNGQSINRKVDLGRCLVSSRWTRPGIVMPGETVVGDPIEKSRSSPGGFASSLGLGRPGDETRLLFLVDGIAFPDPDPDLPFVELRGLVHCPGLKRHLNLSGVFEDEEWQQLMGHLREQVVEMAEAAASAYDSMDSEAQLVAASILEELADVASERGATETAQALLNKVLATREHAMRVDDPRLTATFLKLARLCEDRDAQEEAVRLYRRVLPHLDSQAQHHLERRNPREAFEVLERAVAVHEKIDPEDVELGQRVLELAQHYRQDQLGRAETLYHRALSLLERGLGPEHERVGAALLSLADLYRVQRDFRGAVGYSRRALEIAEKHHGQDGKYLYPYLHQMAEILKGMGEYGESLGYSERALMAKHGRL